MQIGTLALDSFEMHKMSYNMPIHFLEYAYWDRHVNVCVCMCVFCVCVCVCVL